MESAIKKLHNKTNTMKHAIAVVMTAVTRYGRKRWNQPYKKLHNNTNTLITCLRRNDCCKKIWFRGLVSHMSILEMHFLAIF